MNIEGTEKGWILPFSMASSIIGWCFTFFKKKKSLKKRALEKGWFYLFQCPP
jgi:hypothetical protein